VTAVQLPLTSVRMTCHGEPAIELTRARCSWLVTLIAGIVIRKPQRPQGERMVYISAFAPTRAIDAC